MSHRTSLARVMFHTNYHRLYYFNIPPVKSLCCLFVCDSVNATNKTLKIILIFQT